MTIGDLLSVYDGHVVVNRCANGNVQEILDTRKGYGDCPFDLMSHEVTNVDVVGFSGCDFALEIEYKR